MKIAIETLVSAPLNTVWSTWINPVDIMQWNIATDGWCCPKAAIDLKVGGQFNYRMETVDGSMGFDFCGEFTRIEPCREISFSLDDDRIVTVEFIETENGIRLVETFDAEDENSAEQQRLGWQTILDRFKQVTEAK